MSSVDVESEDSGVSSQGIEAYLGSADDDNNGKDDSNGVSGYINNAYLGSTDDVASDGARDVAVSDIKNNYPEVFTSQDGDLRCGLGLCKPKCLQVFNNSKAILVWLCWFAFLQGFMCNGINNVNTSSVERRFELSSFEAGFISSSYDIAAAILVIPVSYYGAHSHQPRILTLAAVSLACGGFVMMSPHFGAGLYELEEPQSGVCHAANSTSAVCEGSSSKLSMWLGVFIIGMILNGLGGTTLYTIGLVFLDTSVSTRLSPLYLGFFYSFSTLGPALGYVLGGYFVENLYVDIDKVDSASITIGANDPRFVGAWWIGFLASGVLLITVVLLLMCYPRELPGTNEVRLKKTNQAHQTSANEVTSREDFGTKWRDMPVALKILLTNPVYMCITLSGVCDGLMVSGIATFMAKFIQNQFAVNPGFAAMLGGAVSVPGAAVGQFLGGLICKLAKFNVRGMLRFNIGVSFIASILVLIILCHCQAPSIAGVNTSYDNSSTVIDDVPELTSYCNQECSCTTRSYEPICGVNGIQYFSACHAGCQKEEINGTMVTVNCTCMDSDVAAGTSMAKEGVCAVDCWLMYIFLPVFFLAICFVFLAVVPSLSATLRVIPYSQRSFGLGIQWVFMRVLGTIPGSILMGFVFDTTCKVWQEKCEERGSCWIYDSKQLSIRVFILCISLKLLSCLLFIIASCLYIPPEKDDKNMSLSETDQTSNKKIAPAHSQETIATTVTTAPDDGYSNPDIDVDADTITDSDISTSISVCDRL